MRAPIALLALFGLSGIAHADGVDIKFGGSITSDIRFRLGGNEITPPNTVVPRPSQLRLLTNGFSRNENVIKTQLSMSIGAKVKAVADVDFYWYGYSDVNNIDMTTMRENIDPYRIDAYAAYIDVYKILPKLDLRIGRQVVVWGTADKFNPTNNLNSLDLSDPLLFGRALANQMVRLDFNPYKDLIITAVWVPIFRPAQLPRTAPYALTQPDRPAPVQEDYIRNTLGFLATVMPPSQINVFAQTPEPTIQNSQFGLRVGGRLLNQDVSLSYYHGRFGIPSPTFTVNHPNGVVDVSVMWPRMDVLGFDIAGSISKLKGMGYWIEGAVTFPQEITYAVYNVTPGGQRQPVGVNPDGSLVLSYPQPALGTVVPSTPFFKMTAGFDLTVTKFWYLNFQYVYGFIDEFGAGRAFYPGPRVGDPPRGEARIGHYLVVGSDFKFFSDALLIRIFGAFKVPQIGDDLPRFSAVIFPQISWAVWDATELSLGSFIFIGDRSTKFGDPASGATELFLKAKFTY